MADYFEPGEIINIPDTGELVIVTAASHEGITIRSRARTSDPFGPEKFLPAAGSFIVRGDTDE